MISRVRRRPERGDDSKSWVWIIRKMEVTRITKAIIRKMETQNTRRITRKTIRKITRTAA